MKRLVPAAIAALLLFSGCGGGDKAPEIMADVSGSRLDVAKSDLKAIGVDEDSVEVVGGGSFGIVVESNWTVCEQTPSAGKKLDGSVRLVVDRSCDVQKSDDAEPSATPTPEAADTPAAAKSEEPETEPAADTFTMPSLVGQVLQDAQDRLQSLGSYNLRQDDATGMERFQVLDSNWKVCGQRPAAGKKLAADDLVVLTAVKLSESCP